MKSSGADAETIQRSLVLLLAIAAVTRWRYLQVGQGTPHPARYKSNLYADVLPVQFRTTPRLNACLRCIRTLFRVLSALSERQLILHGQVIPRKLI